MRFTMNIFEKIAERRIQEAIKNGELDNLPNKGRSLDLDEDGFVPEELRLAYKVLKNSGCIPPELELHNEVVSLRSLIDTIDDDKERLKKIRELNFRIMKLNEQRKRPFHLDNLPEYEDRITKKIL